ESCSSDEALIRLAVTDTGIGISKEKQVHLFEQFTQADASTTRRFGGTGLGLAICKALAELMGGYVGLESNENQGSTFYAVLPLARQGTADTAMYHAELQGLHVLIVDDVEAVRSTLQEGLTACGLLVSTAASSKAALSRLRDQAVTGTPVKVVLLDYPLPNDDSLALTQTLRADPALQDVRVILLGAGSIRNEREALATTGCSTLINKPVRLPALLDELSRLQQPAQLTVPQVPDSLQTEKTGLPVNLRVLLAEDNVVNQKVAARMLEKLGVRVDVANNGLEAVRMCLQFRYDMIFMDCQMPEMDGYAATREIRRLQALTASPLGVPVIALTANTLEGDRERCLDAGMNDFLGKPIRQQDLLNLLLRHIPAHAAEAGTG
ncbi:MAG: response regulator, partial [Moraxellaceae bacterium]